MMETMKEVSSHGGENEKFKPYLIVKGKIENRGVAVDIVLYIYIFFFQIYVQFDFKSTSFLFIS